MKDERRLLSKKELLEIFVDHRVDSPFPGDWESIYKGTGYEFWSLRELAPSEPFRNIDWKATARFGKYHVRERLAESYFNLAILYDISKSVSFGRKEILQANIAAALAYSATVANNGCGLVLFADKVIDYIPPRMGWANFHRIVSAIANAAPTDRDSSGLDAACEKLVNELPESLAFIISDFLYPIELGRSFVRRENARHEVRGLRVLENCEISLPEDSAGMLPVFDLETGERMVLDLSDTKTYNRHMESVLKEAESALNSLGVDIVTIAPGQDHVRKINEFMQRRPRR